MQATKKRLAGPVYIASSATNIYNPASGIVGYLDLALVANVTNAAATYSLYIGATGGSAGGTEIAKTISVPANTTVPFYLYSLKLKATDFLTGICETGASKLTITISGQESAAE